MWSSNSEQIRSNSSKLSDFQQLRKINESGYTYLEIVEIDKIKEKKMKENSKKYSQRLR